MIRFKQKDDSFSSPIRLSNIIWSNISVDFTQSFCFLFAKYRCEMIRWLVLQGESEIRAEFGKLDADNSGFITKGGRKALEKVFKSYNYLLSDEMISVITDCDHFSGDKVRPRLGEKLVLYKQIRTLGHLLYITFVKDHSPPTFHETFALNGPEACVLPSLLNQQIKSFKSGVKDKLHTSK